MSALKSLCLNEFVKQLIINSNKNQIERKVEEKTEVYQQAEITEQLELKQPRIENKEKTINQLISFLEEQGINKMECPGADKPVILVRNDLIRPIQLSLSNEEINKILEEANEMSENKEENIIKATINNWNFTGLISEFGGNRFILQRSDYTSIK